MEPIQFGFSRRHFLKGLGVSMGSVALSLPARAEQTQEGTMVRSNEFLSIGIERATGRAFVEEKVSGETWVWDWRQIAAADVSSFSARGRESLKPLQPFALLPATNGFALEYREPWGRFRCAVELDGSEVLFRAEPDVLYPCELGAVQFPSALLPENDARPIVLDTVNGGRMHNPPRAPWTLR